MTEEKGPSTPKGIERTIVTAKNGDTLSFFVIGTTVDDIEITGVWNVDKNRQASGEEIDFIADRDHLRLQAYQKQTGKKPGPSKRKPEGTIIMVDSQSKQAERLQ